MANAKGSFFTVMFKTSCVTHPRCCQCAQMSGECSVSSAAISPLTQAPPMLSGRGLLATTWLVRGHIRSCNPEDQQRGHEAGQAADNECQQVIPRHAPNHAATESGKAPPT